MSQTKKPTTVRVTEAHVRRGKQQDPCLCPVALAVAEAVPGSSPHVNPCFIFLSIENRRTSVATPPAVGEAVRRYDHGGDMEPFTFELEV